MKKNGFVFIETIVAIIVLTSSLLLLYSSFNNVLQNEKTRVYYDDVTYIYRTYYIKDRISRLNLRTILNDLNNDQDKYFITIGIEYDKLFTGYDKEKEFIKNMFADYDVKQIILLKENRMDNLKKCSLECSLNTNCDEYENCNVLYTNLSDEFISYLKSIYIDVSCNNIMAVEYSTCNSDNTNCKNYYSWVSV